MSKEYYQKNKERIKKKVLENRKQNKPLYDEIAQRYRDKNRDSINAKHSATVMYNRRRICKKFGILVADYDALFEGQNGCCAICKTHQSELKRSLAVDHDHETGEIRGLLCSVCNRAIGMLKDDTIILQSCIEYINNKKTEKQ